MSTTGAIEAPGDSGRDKVVVAAVGFPEDFRRMSLYFSVFMLVFPPMAIVENYINDDRTILLSLPLLLMAVCGAFGMRLSRHLERST